MLNEYVEAATTGGFHIEFIEISLSRNGVQPDQNPLRGKGYLIQDGERFRFTLFPDDKAPPSPDYFWRYLMSAGNLIPEDAFFTAHCVTFRGTRWIIENILPRADLGPSGYVVHAEVREVHWDEKLPADLGGSPHKVTLCFLGKHDFEANEIVKTERTVGNNTPSTSLSFTAAVIKDVPGIQIRIEKHETYITLSAWSDQPLPPTFQLAAWQAFEFSLGRILVCVLAGERCDAKFMGVIRPWADPEKQPYCEPPTVPNRTDTQGGYWALFSKVLVCLMKKDTTSDVLSSCSSDVISVGNSLLGVQALVRCVAVESLCKMIAKNGAGNDGSLKEDRKKLIAHLGNGGYVERFIERVKGFLNAMSNMRPKDTLDRLKGAGLVEEEHITIWSHLRNSRVHGRVVSGKVIEDDFNRMRAVLGLFYRLVFHIVGYTGSSKDYLRPEQPIIRRVTKEEMDKELAAIALNNSAPAKRN